MIEEYNDGYKKIEINNDGERVETYFTEVSVIVNRYFEDILIVEDIYYNDTTVRIVKRYSSDNKYQLTEYYKNEKRHREDGPAVIENVTVKNKIIEKYFINDENVTELYHKTPEILTDASLRKILR